MRALQDPVEIGIMRGIESDRRMIDAALHMIAELAVDMLEKRRVTAQPAHGGVGEEQFQQETPAPTIPTRGDEARALFLWAGDENVINGPAVMHQRQQPSAE